VLSWELKSWRLGNDWHFGQYIFAGPLERILNQRSLVGFAFLLKLARSDRHSSRARFGGWLQVGNSFTDRQIYRVQFPDFSAEIDR